MNIKNLISDLFGFTQDIYQLPQTYQVKYRDIYAVSESQLANTKLNLEKAENKIIKLKKELELLAKQVTQVKPILPNQFVLATDTYKSGFRIYFKDKDGNDKNIYVSGKVSGTHLTLTPVFDNIIKESNIYTKDTELEVFNKILGWVQKNTSYCYDQNQWGTNQYENWEPAIIVYGTRKADCESVSSLVISAFQYWQLLNNKKDTYPFIGVGLYAKSYGHGFPCLLTGADLDNDLFIGEATLSVQRESKPLKDCNNMYWCNWGAHSFWHEFRIKKELEWWNETTATPINNSKYTGSEKMTGKEINVKDALVKDEKQFKKKKKLIEDFWK